MPRSALPITGSKDQIKRSSLELAQLMSDRPDLIDRDLISQGENLVGVFADPNFTMNRFPQINDLKISALLEAIMDIAKGLVVLKTSSYGVSYHQNALKVFTLSHGTLPEGDPVLSVSWKDIAAFKRWRKMEDFDIDQENLNAAIYYLVFRVSELNQVGKSKDKR